MYKVNNKMLAKESNYLVYEYEGFGKLMTQLQTYVNNNGISKDLQMDLKEVEDQVLEEKHNYMQVLQIYEIIQEILVENNYGLNDARFEEVEGHRFNIYQTLSQLLAASQCKNSLKISSSASDKEKEKLFGLKREDFELELKDKKIIHQNIQQACIPLIEGKLQKKSLEVYRYWKPTSEDSEGLMLAKANQMATLVKKEKEKLNELKNSLKENQDLFTTITYNNHKKLQSSLQRVEKLKLSCKSNEETGLASVTASMIDAKCDYFLGKIRVMKDHLYAETYANDALEALQQIKIHLDEEIKKTKKELKQTQYSLSAYESVGVTFTQLLNQYTQLTMDIDNKKWALSELLKSKST